jgi:hypothetical protein
MPTTGKSNTNYEPSENPRFEQSHTETDSRQRFEGAHTVLLGALFSVRPPTVAHQ